MDMDSERGYGRTRTEIRKPSSDYISPDEYDMIAKGSAPAGKTYGVEQNYEQDELDIPTILREKKSLAQRYGVRG
jgi:hypothetical protein